MSKKTSKNQEFDHFTSIAKLNGGNLKVNLKYYIKLLPIRIKYILQNIEKKNIKKLDILDLGCGGGLTCEPLARLNANVTGIDFVKENIEIAKNHARQSELMINYIHDDINSINLKKKYDLILMLEIIEHLEEWDVLISKFKKNLKPKGMMIFSTINRTQISKIFTIFVAENILKWIPKKTHNYNKLITPQELKTTLIKNDFKITDIMGMNLNPLTQEWKLNKNLLPMNYFCTAILN